MTILFYLHPVLKSLALPLGPSDLVRPICFISSSVEGFSYIFCFIYLGLDILGSSDLVSSFCFISAGFDRICFKFGGPEATADKIKEGLS